jgi:hypothetical protein
VRIDEHAAIDGEAGGSGESVVGHEADPRHDEIDLLGPPVVALDPHSSGRGLRDAAHSASGAHIRSGGDVPLTQRRRQQFGENARAEAFLRLEPTTATRRAARIAAPRRCASPTVRSTCTPGRSPPSTGSGRARPPVHRINREYAKDSPAPAVTIRRPVSIACATAPSRSSTRSSS